MVRPGSTRNGHFRSGVHHASNGAGPLMSRAPLLLLLALLGWPRVARADWELGGGWRTARSPHFIVHGQTTDRTLELAVVRFEETRLALASTFFPGTWWRR
jgi:hypothetical protein